MTWPKNTTCRPDDNVARNVVHVWPLGITRQPHGHLGAAGWVWEVGGWLGGAPPPTKPTQPPSDTHTATWQHPNTCECVCAHEFWCMHVCVCSQNSFPDSQLPSQDPSHLPTFTHSPKNTHSSTYAHMHQNLGAHTHTHG